MTIISLSDTEVKSFNNNTNNSNIIIKERYCVDGDNDTYIYNIGIFKRVINEDNSINYQLIDKILSSEFFNGDYSANDRLKLFNKFFDLCYELNIKEDYFDEDNNEVVLNEDRLTPIYQFVRRIRMCHNQLFNPGERDHFYHEVISIIENENNKLFEEFFIENIKKSINAIIDTHESNQNNLASILNSNKLIFKIRYAVFEKEPKKRYILGATLIKNTDENVFNPLPDDNVWINKKNINRFINTSNKKKILTTDNYYIFFNNIYNYKAIDNMFNKNGITDKWYLRINELINLEDNFLFFDMRIAKFKDIFEEIRNENKGDGENNEILKIDMSKIERFKCENDQLVICFKKEKGE